MTIKIYDTKTHTSYLAHHRSDCIGIDVHIWDMIEITGQTVTMGLTVGNRVA